MYKPMDMWQQHLDHVAAIPTDKPTLIVLKGFERSFFQETPMEKLLSIGLEITIQELQRAKVKLLPEVFGKIGSGTKEDCYWFTFEEMLTLGPEIVSLYFQVVILKNNLYHRTFPCLYGIEQGEELYQKHFAREEWSGVNTPELDAFQEYYGDLKRIGERFFVTYAVESEDQDFYIHARRPLMEKVQSAYETASLELSEEEDNFLAFLDEVIQGKLEEGEIHITYSGELSTFPNLYIKRLELLQWLYQDRYHFVLTNKEIEKKWSMKRNIYRFLRSTGGILLFDLLRCTKM